LTPSRESLPGIAAGTLFALLLLTHVGVRSVDTRLDELGAFRRLWSDEALATTALVDARTGGAAARRPRNPESVATCRRLIVERVDALQIRPWQFWRTIRAEPFIRERIDQEPAPFDDPGRAFLLGLAFRALGGVAPYLVFWLAPLFVLALSRSPVGFYLVAWLALVALAVFAILGPPPTPQSLLLRCALAGLVFGVCGPARRPRLQR
jgi:hypothetical protein